MHPWGTDAGGNLSSLRQGSVRKAPVRRGGDFLGMAVELRLSNLSQACGEAGRGSQTLRAGEPEVTLHQPAWANRSFWETSVFILGPNMVGKGG